MTFDLGADGVLRWKPWQQLPWLVHGFSTRAAGDFSALDRDRIHWSGEEFPLAMLRQIHSDKLYVIATAHESAAPALPEGDGLLASNAGVLVGVRTADCLPLLLVDRRSRAVAAVHAGWRGSAQKIAAKAVEKLTREMGARPEDLEAVIGPGIGVCCYEVGEEVAGQFDGQFAVRFASQFDGAEAEREERLYLDLAAANRAQLVEAGVPASQIHLSGMCTQCLADQFYSYRREGDKAGRMLAVVGVRADGA
jgi:purine-nucleoside/S-methyl-5'-thioadenosine phosphorylase / adenosine deaminase